MTTTRPPGTPPVSPSRLETTWEGIKNFRVSTMVTVALFVVAVLVSAGVRPNFFSQYSLTSVFAGFLPLVLLAVAQSVVVIGSGLDLSVGAIAGLSSVVALTVMGGSDGKVVLGFIVAVAIGAACGLLNGLIVSGLRLQPLITTFATASIFAGMTLWVLPTPGGAVPPMMTQTFRLAFAGVPVTVWLVIAVALLWWVLSRTKLVRHIYAVGGDPAAAYASLIPVRATQASSYVLAGVFAALAGLTILANTGAGDPFVGEPMALNSVAAVVIGGIALRGGIGSPIGAIAGAMVLSLLTAILFFVGIPSTYRPLAEGMIVIAALALSAMTSRRAVKA